MKRIIATALWVALPLVVLVAIRLGHRSTAGSLAVQGSSFRAIFPILMQNGGPDALPPATVETPGATPGTARPTSTPATATPLPTLESLHGDVVFQLATFGGLNIEINLGRYVPSQTPLFTLYEDGFYVRIFEGYLDGGDYGVERFEGMLGDSGRTEIVRRLVERLVMLAEIVDAFEAPLDFDRITLVATKDNDWGGDEPAPDWPLGPEVRLADVPREAWWHAMQVEGEMAREIVRSIDEHLINWPNVATFADDGVNFIVGARVEFAGWDAYR